MRAVHPTRAALHLLAAPQVRASRAPHPAAVRHPSPSLHDAGRPDFIPTNERNFIVFRSGPVARALDSIFRLFLAQSGSRFVELGLELA